MIAGTHRARQFVVGKLVVHLGQYRAEQLITGRRLRRSRRTPSVRSRTVADTLHGQADQVATVASR